MTDSLSPVALSRLTWTAEDRRAWDEAYRATLWIHVRREERIRVARERSAVLRAARREQLARRAATIEPLHGGCVPVTFSDYSVHVDVLAGREG
jgi:hypothetical protein